MASPSGRFAGARDYCPHCNYALVGLPDATRVCPECGGELSALAFAKAAARQIAKTAGARMSLLLSPVVGCFVVVLVVSSGRGQFAAAIAFLLCIWTGAAKAIYFTSDSPGERRPLRAALLGLPLGVAYLLAMLTAALVVALIMMAVKELK